MDYLYPRSIEEAIQALESDDGKTRVVAGCTDVMPDLRSGKISPQRLLDITAIPGLDRITVGDGFIQVGAAVTLGAIQESPQIQTLVPALIDAASSVGAQAIRNSATWVGNLIQAMPAADGAIIALALEAEILVIDRRGDRWLPVSSLFKGPGVSVIDSCNQIVTHLRFPLPAGRWGTAWDRIGRRPSLVLPILNCAVGICLNEDGRIIESAAIALGPVAPRPFRAFAAETSLNKKPISPEIIDEAVRLAQLECNPRDSAARASRAYRQTVIPALLESVIKTAIQRAQKNIYKPTKPTFKENR